MSPLYFALWHVRTDERGCDHDKLLGIYSSREKAEQGLAMLREKPGFRDHPEGFEIPRGKMDETYMLKGFATVWGDEEPEIDN